jgi:integrase
MKPRQQRDYRRAVEKFHAWKQKPIEDVNRKVAGLYIAEAFVSKKTNPKTANKDISCLSSFWTWLEKRGHAESNPWEGQSLSKKLMPKSSKRPYTDAEICKLLTSTDDTLLLDVMKVAALSGMRREEIMLLRVSDTVDGMFNIQKAKTQSGIRTVPIHTQLNEIVRRLTVDKASDDFLFDVTGEGGGVVERGDYFGKRFNTYRKRVGIDERSEGQRQSNIDFHSFRRWFIATARNALQNGAVGYDPWTIAEVVGHDTRSPESELRMTMGVYPGPQRVEAKRACVEAVKLPRR